MRSWPPTRWRWQQAPWSTAPDGVTITSGSGEAVSGAYLVFPRKVLTSGMKAQAQAGAR